MLKKKNNAMVKEKNYTALFDPDSSLYIKHVSDLCFNKIYLFLSSLLQVSKSIIFDLFLFPPFLSLSVGLLLWVRVERVPLTACEASVLMRERMARR